MGATATDHAALTPYTARLSDADAAAIFDRARAGEATPDDLHAFTGHMLMEMARMSVDDGLVMQLHPGSARNHNRAVFERFGPDRGCDIPLATEYTRNLQPLLNAYGNDARFRLVLFTLDETTYSRELAPLAGHYPALRLGPPWWFHDSLEGMERFRRQVTETAGLYNTAGFNDDTRAFPSIPARHDLCRRVDANFLAGQVARHVMDLDEAEEAIVDLSYNLARETYRFAGAERGRSFGNSRARPNRVTLAVTPMRPQRHPESAVRGQCAESLTLLNAPRATSARIRQSTSHTAGSCYLSGMDGTDSRPGLPSTAGARCRNWHSWRRCARKGGLRESPSGRVLERPRTDLWSSDRRRGGGGMRCRRRALAMKPVVELLLREFARWRCTRARFRSGATTSSGCSTADLRRRVGGRVR